MQHTTRSIVVGLILVGLQLSACGQTPAGPVSKSEPAHVEPIAGTELNHVILVAAAAERLDIQTVAAREEQITRKRTVGGAVVTQPTEAMSSADTRALVRVPLSAGDADTVDRSQPASILPLAQASAASGLTATLVEPPTSDEPKGAVESLYYAIERKDHGLVPGQRVRVELALIGSGMQQTVIPYGSVIYDLNGDTWIYTSPEALTFVRERIIVDYIDGELAILAQGPRAGTKIVSVGVAELYGTEFGVGH